MTGIQSPTVVAVQRPVDYELAEARCVEKSSTSLPAIMFNLPDDLYPDFGPSVEGNAVTGASNKPSKQIRQQWSSKQQPQHCQAVSPGRDTRPIGVESGLDKGPGQAAEVPSAFSRPAFDKKQQAQSDDRLEKISETVKVAPRNRPTFTSRQQHGASGNISSNNYIGPSVQPKYYVTPTSAAVPCTKVMGSTAASTQGASRISAHPATTDNQACNGAAGMVQPGQRWGPPPAARDPHAASAHMQPASRPGHAHNQQVGPGGAASCPGNAHNQQLLPAGAQPLQVHQQPPPPPRAQQMVLQRQDPQCAMPQRTNDSPTSMLMDTPAAVGAFPSQRYIAPGIIEVRRADLKRVSSDPLVAAQVPQGPSKACPPGPSAAIVAAPPPPPPKPGPPPPPPKVAHQRIAPGIIEVRRSDLRRWSDNGNDPSGQQGAVNAPTSGPAADVQKRSVTPPARLPSNAPAAPPAPPEAQYPNSRPAGRQNQSTNSTPRGAPAILSTDANQAGACRARPLPVAPPLPITEPSQHAAGQSLVLQVQMNGFCPSLAPTTRVVPNYLQHPAGAHRAVGRQGANASVAGSLAIPCPPPLNGANGCTAAQNGRFTNTSYSTNALTGCNPAPQPGRLTSRQASGSDVADNAANDQQTTAVAPSGREQPNQQSIARQTAPQDTNRQGVIPGGNGARVQPSNGRHMAVLKAPAQGVDSPKGTKFQAPSQGGKGAGMPNKSNPPQGLNSPRKPNFRGGGQGNNSPRKANQPRGFNHHKKSPLQAAAQGANSPRRAALDNSSSSNNVKPADDAAGSKLRPAGSPAAQPVGAAPNVSRQAANGVKMPAGNNRGGPSGNSNIPNNHPATAAPYNRQLGHLGVGHAAANGQQAGAIGPAAAARPRHAGIITPRHPPLKPAGPQTAAGQPSQQKVAGSKQTKQDATPPKLFMSDMEACSRLFAWTGSSKSVEPVWTYINKHAMQVGYMLLMAYSSCHKPLTSTCTVSNKLVDKCNAVQKFSAPLAFAPSPMQHSLLHDI